MDQLNQNTTPSLPPDKFWRWLHDHANCILRAGGVGYLLFDMPDIHWHLGEDGEGNHVVQLIKGKDLLAEMVFNPSDVLYVQATPDEGEQTLFECVGTVEGQPVPVCHFLLAHAYDEEPPLPARKWTH